jgi:hypothetical protein
MELELGMLWCMLTTSYAEEVLGFAGQVPPVLCVERRDFPGQVSMCFITDSIRNCKLCLRVLQRRGQRCGVLSGS